MFNVLPDSLKDNIIREYKERRWVVILLFFIFAQLIFLVFMMPSWIISKSRELDVIEQVSKMDKSETFSTANSLKPVIRTLNNELGIINRTLEYQEFTPIFDAVLSKKTNSIKITDISYVGNSSTTAVMVLQGVSSTRDALVNFKEGLADLKLFKTIDLPISNYAKEKNIDFSITLISSPAK